MARRRSGLPGRYSLSEARWTVPLSRGGVVMVRYRSVDNRGHGTPSRPWLVVDNHGDREVCSCMTRQDARAEVQRLDRAARAANPARGSSLGYELPPTEVV